MVVLHRDTTAGHANAQCSTGVCRPKLARCACTAPSRVLEGATAGQHRPDPGPARRLAAASPAFRTHVIIYGRDPALGGAWAALRARYRARDAKVNNQWRTAAFPAHCRSPRGEPGRFIGESIISRCIIPFSFLHLFVNAAAVNGARFARSAAGAEGKSGRWHPHALSRRDRSG